MTHSDDELIEAVAERVMGWHKEHARYQMPCWSGAVSRCPRIWVAADGWALMEVDIWKPHINDAHMDMVLAKWTDRMTRLYGDRTGWTACVSPATGGPDRMAVSDGLTMKSLKRAILLAMVEGKEYDRTYHCADVRRCSVGCRDRQDQRAGGGTE